MLKITVIGLGLMGGSLVKALKKSKKNYRIWAIDTNKKNIKSALKDKYIEKGFYNYSNIKEAFEFADIIMICSIPSIALNIIKKYKNLIDDKKILSDFCGVKKIFSKRLQIKNISDYILWREKKKADTIIQRKVYLKIQTL